MSFHTFHTFHTFHKLFATARVASLGAAAGVPEAEVKAEAARVDRVVADILQQDLEAAVLVAADTGARSIDVYSFFGTDAVLVDRLAKELEPFAVATRTAQSGECVVSVSW